VEQKGSVLFVKGKNKNETVLFKTSGSDMDLALYFKCEEHESNTTQKTLYGDFLKRISFKNIKELQEFKKEFQELEIWGDFPFPNQYITQKKLYENPDFDSIHVGYLDIEIESERILANPENPLEEINVISVWSSLQNKMFTFCKSSTPLSNCFTFETERELLLAFLKCWKELNLDVVSSWNGEFFDFPYIFYRIRSVLSDKHAQSLSPFNVVQESQVERMGKQQTSIKIFGVIQLDYLDLYKKFTFDPRDNYRLNTIAEAELGEQKLDYSQYNSLKEFYQKDFATFVRYNQKDVELLIALEQKLKLILLTQVLSYRAKQNFVDVFSPIRTWDSFCYNYLFDRQLVVQPQKRFRKSESFKGAFVVDPIPGRYSWVATFDVTSLYPSVIRLLNISPETLDTSVRLPELIKNKEYIIDEYISGAFSNPISTHSLSANCQFFKQDQQGMMPALIYAMFNDRIQINARINEKEKELEQLKKRLKQLEGNAP